MTSEKIDTPAILLVDDHPLFLEGIKNLLTSKLSNFSVYSSQNVEQGEEFFEKEDLILLVMLDIRVYGEDTLKFMKKIKKQSPKTSVIVMSGYVDYQIQQEYLKAGASAFIDKNQSIEEILSKVMEFIPQKHLEEAIKENKEKLEGDREIHAKLESLSPRQKEILKKILEGKANKIIAMEENISEITVKIHVSAILKAMEADNRAHLIYLLNRSNINEISKSF